MSETNNTDATSDKLIHDHNRGEETRYTIAIESLDGLGRLFTRVIRDKRVASALASAAVASNKHAGDRPDLLEEISQLAFVDVGEIGHAHLGKVLWRLQQPTIRTKKKKGG